MVYLLYSSVEIEAQHDGRRRFPGSPESGTIDLFVKCGHILVPEKYLQYRSYNIRRSWRPKLQTVCRWRKCWQSLGGNKWNKANKNQRETTEKGNGSSSPQLQWHLWFGASIYKINQKSTVCAPTGSGLNKIHSDHTANKVSWSVWRSDILICRVLLSSQLAAGTTPARPRHPASQEWPGGYDLRLILHEDHVVEDDFKPLYSQVEL